MNDKIDDILIRIGKIENYLRPRTSMLSIIFKFIGKLLTPIALGIFAFIADQASNKISNAQLELARRQDVRQEAEFKNNLQLKYIEVFYKEITSHSVEKQLAALSLLRLMEPELGTVLANWVESNSKISPEIRAKTESIARDIATFGVLNNYKIGIYFRNNRPDLSRSANEIRNKLVKYGFNGQIKLYKRDDSFFQEVIPPTTYEIRYEPDYEADAADRLETILNEVYPSKRFRKQAVEGRTINFISLFLGP